MLFSDSNSLKALEMWEGNFVRVTSTLLRIECIVNVQKSALSMPEQIQKPWITSSIKWLQLVFSQFYLLEMDENVYDEIANNNLYGKCRSLDAIHIATAHIFAREADAFSIATFDSRMSKVAEELGLIVAL